MLLNKPLLSLAIIVVVLRDSIKMNKQKKQMSILLVSLFISQAFVFLSLSSGVQAHAH